VIQSLLAFCILLTFNIAAIGLGVLSLLPVAIYPFAKRFTWWPQVFLGLAFNWGALLAWTAHTGSLGWPAVFLYLRHRLDVVLRHDLRPSGRRG
jgi:4-hydroxybenzoate polyprenyltransferase